MFDFDHESLLGMDGDKDAKALREERRRQMEREGKGGQTLLTGSSLRGKPLLSSQIVQPGFLG